MNTRDMVQHVVFTQTRRQRRVHSDQTDRLAMNTRDMVQHVVFTQTRQTDCSCPDGLSMYSMYVCMYSMYNDDHDVSMILSTFSHSAATLNLQTTELGLQLRMWK